MAPSANTYLAHRRCCRLEQLGHSKVHARLALKEYRVSNKKPSSESDRPQGAAGEAQNGEPIIVKDRRFWGKKAKDAADAPATQSAPEQPDDAAQAAHDAAVAAHLSTIADLEQRIADKDARLNATVAQYKEALDEFEGAKARLKRDVAKDVAAGKRAILVGLLDVIDNLERALATAPKPGAQAAPSDAKVSQDYAGLYNGVTMVRDQFVAKLTALGVTRILALGEPFDPLHFEAVSTMPVASAKEHDTVVGVVRDAYLLSGETLRHGIVAVGKHQGS